MSVFFIYLNFSNLVHQVNYIFSFHLNLVILLEFYMYYIYIYIIYICMWCVVCVCCVCVSVNIVFLFIHSCCI